MKAKDVVCIVALLVVATGAARVVLASGAPCTGWAGACHFTPSPVPPGLGADRQPAVSPSGELMAVHRHAAGAGDDDSRRRAV